MQVAGSPDTEKEQYPFEVACIEQDPWPTIIVLDGRGYAPGAKTWLMEQRNEKLLDVCDMGEISRMQSTGRL